MQSRQAMKGAFAGAQYYRKPANGPRRTKPVTHRVRLRPSGHVFTVEGRESLLDAALRAGVHLDHGCATGQCGRCRARLLNGKIVRTRNGDYPFTVAEQQQGFFLTCVATAGADTEIEAAEARSEDDIPLQRLRVSVRKIELLDRDAALVRLRTPRSQLLRFLAGQRIRLTAPDGRQDEWHVASCPCDGRNLDIVVCRDRPDDLAAYLLDASAPGATLSLEGPFGTFLLDETSCKPLVFVAIGAGIAPVLSQIEQAISEDHAERVDLYRVDSCCSGNRLGNLCRSWQDALENFAYHPVVDTVSAEVLATRLVKDGVTAGADVYVAGPSAAIAPMQDLLAGSAHRLHLESTD